MTIGLAIYTEAGVLLTLDQIVLSLVAVKAPMLDGQGLVEVIVAACNLVRVFDCL